MTSSRRPRFDPEKVPSPCFVLDEQYLRENLELLHRIKKEAGISILVALKGFAMWSTFPLLKKYLDGATASSLNEAILIREEFGEMAHLCAPVYLESEIEKITGIASHITFNSLQQYYRFQQYAFHNSLKMAIRINPEYSEVVTELYNPCMPGSRLGVTRAELGNDLPPGITGLHFHTLCEQNSDALENTLMAVEEKFDHFLDELEWLNIGGGHHFTRSDYDLGRFIRVVSGFKNRHNLNIIAEPGEAVGWQTGFLVATVQDIIHTNGFKTAMLDVSFSAHMPDCLEMPYKPKIWGALEPTPGLPTYRMGGNTCLAGDFMGDYSFDESLKPGDRIVFDDMIHYTMVKTTNFNGVNLPSIGIWKEDNSFQLIRSFGYEEYKSRLS
jgi:carboxynorspermidine decarboxylase